MRIILLFAVALIFSCNRGDYQFKSDEKLKSLVEKYEHLNLIIYEDDLIKLNGFFLSLNSGIDCEQDKLNDYEIRDCLIDYCENFSLDYHEVSQIIGLMHSYRIEEVIRRDELILYLKSSEDIYLLANLRFSRKDTLTIQRLKQLEKERFSYVNEFNITFQEEISEGVWKVKRSSPHPN